VNPGQTDIYKTFHRGNFKHSPFFSASESYVIWVWERLWTYNAEFMPVFWNLIPCLLIKIDWSNQQVGSNGNSSDLQVRAARCQFQQRHQLFDFEIFSLSTLLQNKCQIGKVTLNRATNFFLACYFQCTVIW